MNSENLQETLYKKKIDTVNVLNIFDVEKYKNGKNIIITGVTGQDGSHMVDYLLKNTDYRIFGGVRRLSVYNHENISHIDSDRFHLVNFDLTDSHAISRIIEVLKPSYFINFAAQSFVASSWDFSRQTWQANSTAVLDILESIRQYSPFCRFYNAGSSEEFGNVSYTPQDEKHPLRPRSPYAASKAAARQLVKVYRESYNLYAVQGWLFNHEGERRGEEFVTRKITKNVSRIINELKEGRTPTPMSLGNVNAKRDWSYAPDFVDGVWRMLNQEEHRNDMKNLPREALMIEGAMERSIQHALVVRLKEYVLSSGETHTIKEFVEESFKVFGYNGKWINDEFWIHTTLFTRHLVVRIDPKFYRPAEVDLLLGDSSSARTELGWSPKTSFKDLVKIMMTSDMGIRENHP